MASEQDTSPSPIVRYLRDSLARVLPEESQNELAAFDGEINATTSHGDLHRAVRCAEWAVEIAGEPSSGKHHHHVATELGEIVRVMRDAEFGLSFGLMVGDTHRAGERLRHYRDNDTSIGIAEDVKIRLVDDALDEAKKVAEASGWSAVPWQALLKELIGAHSPGAPQ
jgi:hypothetical protein